MAGYKRGDWVVILMMVYVIIGGLGTRRTNGMHFEPVCMENCMPICMRLRGATDEACVFGCNLGCEQLLGKGRRFVFPEDDDQV